MLSYTRPITCVKLVDVEAPIERTDVVKGVMLEIIASVKAYR